jgi:hypothetical protein
VSESREAAPRLDGHMIARAVQLLASMGETIVGGLIGGVIGGVSALGVGWLLGRQRIRHEVDQYARERSDEEARATRERRLRQQERAADVLAPFGPLLATLEPYRFLLVNREREPIDAGGSARRQLDKRRADVLVFAASLPDRETAQKLHGLLDTINETIWTNVWFLTKGFDAERNMRSARFEECQKEAAGKHAEAKSLLEELIDHFRTE